MPYYNHENLNHIRLFVDQSLKPIYMFIKDIRRSQMSNEDHNWEFGIRDDGHSVITEADTKPVVLGEGKFQYEVSGLN